VELLSLVVDDSLLKHTEYRIPKELGYLFWPKTYWKSKLSLIVMVTFNYNDSRPSFTSYAQFYTRPLVSRAVSSHIVCMHACSVHTSTLILVVVVKNSQGLPFFFPYQYTKSQDQLARICTENASSHPTHKRGCPIEAQARKIKNLVGKSNNEVMSFLIIHGINYVSVPRTTHNTRWI